MGCGFCLSECGRFGVREVFRSLKGGFLRGCFEGCSDEMAARTARDGFHGVGEARMGLGGRLRLRAMTSCESGSVVRFQLGFSVASNEGTVSVSVGQLVGLRARVQRRPAGEVSRCRLRRARERTAERPRPCFGLNVGPSGVVDSRGFRRAVQDCGAGSTPASGSGCGGGSSGRSEDRLPVRTRCVRPLLQPRDCRCSAAASCSGAA